MNAGVHGIYCFPNIADKFITWGTEINLYELKTIATQPADTEEHKYFELQQPEAYNKSEIPVKIPANLLTSEDHYQYIRCVKPSFYETPLVAVGLSNGKVGICDFEPNKSSSTTEEFIPRQQRTCLCLAWNEIDKNYLAIGHDRNRSDYCISIWDIQRPSNAKDTNSFSGIGLSETAHSLCWDKSNRSIIAGMSQKTIRVFDLRQSTTQVSSNINTRLVHGLTLSPNGNYLASYADAAIAIWDMRNLEKPLIQMPTTMKNISCISWCSTRSNVLSATSRAASHLMVIEVNPENGNELSYTRKNLSPSSLKGSNGSSNINNKPKNISGLSWHPTLKERALILLDDGTLEDYNIPARISISIDSKSNLWNSYLSDHVSTGGESKDSCDLEDDLPKIMRERAIKGYGLLPEDKNGDVTNNATLKSVWKMMGKISADDNQFGLKNILGIDSNQAGENIFTTRSEILTLSWPEFIKKSVNVLTTYRNESRTKAQALCGWDFENDMNTLQNKFLPDLCTRREYTRAAMIAVFYLKISYACDILLKATDQNMSDPSILRMAAIALSSFDSDNTSNVYKQHQALASSQIRDPYLRTIFSFLTIENENFDVILMEKGISLGDRVAFACKYLNDIKLVEYIKLLIQKCIQDGDLNGLLLTGDDSTETINLMQAYIDRYDDVQTVSLLTIRLFNFDKITDYRIKLWISSYLELLDRWGLWEKRAELEIKMNKNRTTVSKSSTSRSVFLLCSFCGKSVSSALTEDARLRNVSSNVNKLSSCPSCRKPLPRCSLCLLHMGTTTAILSHSKPEHESLGWQSKPFSKWFSWCQTCRHGGHTEHLMEWFKKNSECTVTGCSCKCFDMDLPVPKFPRDN